MRAPLARVEVTGPAGPGRGRLAAADDLRRAGHVTGRPALHPRRRRHRDHRRRRAGRLPTEHRFVSGLLRLPALAICRRIGVDAAPVETAPTHRRYGGHDRWVTEAPHTDSSAPLSGGTRGGAADESGGASRDRVAGRGAVRGTRPASAERRWGGRPADRSRARFLRWQTPGLGYRRPKHRRLWTPSSGQWIGVLHAGHGAVFSHVTAARRAGLRWVGRDTIDVLTPEGRLVAPLPGYFFHQTRRPYARWVSPVAAPAAAAGARRPARGRTRPLRTARDRSACGLRSTGPVYRETGLVARSHNSQAKNGKTFRLVLGDIAGGAQSFAELNIGHLCAVLRVDRADPAGGPTRQGGPTTLPGLRLGSARRPTWWC